MDEQGTNKKENEDCKIITLFHFTRLENIFDIIEKDRLKVFVLGKSNDPTESRVSISQEAGESDGKGLQVFFNSREFPAVSMSSAIKNLPMWERYGGNYSGVSLVYQFEVTKAGIVFNDRRIQLLPVSYAGPMPRIEKETAESDIIRLFYDAVTTKGEEWKEEQETRVSVSEKSIRYDSGSLYTYGFNKYLRGVVLGPKCEAPKLLIRKLLEKAGLPDLPISKAIFSENSYSVEVLGEEGTWGAIKPPPCDMRENAISALIERNKEH